MHARRLPNGRMLAPPAPSFWMSWRVIAIFICLTIWTPILPMRPFPPFRLDDPWIILVALMQFTRSNRLSPAIRYFPFWGYLLLGLSFFISTAHASTSVIELTEISDSFIYLRWALILWVIASTTLPPNDVFKIFVAFVFACALTYPIIFVQGQAIQPWATMTTKIWSRGDMFLQQYKQLRFTKRAIGTVGNPNYLGILVWGNAAVCIALLVIRRGTSGLFIKLFLLVNALVALPIILFMLKSRAALVCFVVVVAYCVIGILKISRKTQFLRLAIVLLVVLGGIGTIAYQVRDSLPPRMAALLEPFHTDKDTVSVLDNMETRMGLWDVAIEQLTFHKQFVFGFGPTNQRVIDSGYFYTLYRQGFVGLAIYMAIWIWALWRSTMGWLATSLSEPEKYVFLLSGILITGGVFFEVTVEGLISAKMGVVLAMAIGLLQRPLKQKTRMQGPPVNFRSKS